VHEQGSTKEQTITMYRGHWIKRTGLKGARLVKDNAQRG
jgi:hypothetical protein